MTDFTQMDAGTRARCLLVAGAHLCACAFADLDAFLDFVLSRLRLSDSCTNAEIIDGCRELAKDLTHDRPAETPTTALETLVAKDLALITGALEAGDWSTRNLLVDVNEVKRQSLAYLAEIGLAPRYDPNIAIVDAFPHPYETADWSAMAPDEDDEEQFGIAPGIYIRRDRAYPFFTEATIAHELLHCVPTDIMRGTFGMGLEEGVCDLLGFLHVGSKLVGCEAIARAFVYYRLMPHVSHLRTLYVDHDRLALSLLASNGIPGLADLLKNGRTKLRESEVDNLQFMTLSRSQTLDQDSFELQRLSDWLLNRYLPHQVIPPLAMLALSHLETRTNLNQLAAMLGTNIDELAPAVQSAASATQLFLMEDDMLVGYSNVPFYLRANDQLTIPMLRYELN